MLNIKSKSILFPVTKLVQIGNHRNEAALALLVTLLTCVVLLVHHGSYTYNLLSYIGFRHYKVDILLQRLAVGGFIFLSGYKLAISKLSDSPINFIKNQ